MNSEEQVMIRELHDFFMKPSHPGKPTRAAQLDEILSVVKTGQLTFRAVLYLAGALVAISVGWQHLRDWFT